MIFTFLQKALKISQSLISDSKNCRVHKKTSTKTTRMFIFTKGFRKLSMMEQSHVKLNYVVLILNEEQ